VSVEGHIDALTSTGFLEGWAHDPERPGYSPEIAVILDKQEVARGMANHYRWDLADIALGIGWCAFRLRINGLISVLRRGPLTLKDVASSTDICTAHVIPVIEEPNKGPDTVAALIKDDPTTLESVDQLRGCGPLFQRYLDRHGPALFVRAAYVYLLGRPADSGGLANYATLLKSGEISPFGLLQILSASEEFRLAPRLLLAPTDPGFAFATDDPF
jgi:hypothetical protein